jgi:hypothetical protein
MLINTKWEENHKWLIASILKWGKFNPFLLLTVKCDKIEGASARGGWIKR